MIEIFYDENDDVSILYNLIEELKANLIKLVEVLDSVRYSFKAEAYQKEDLSNESTVLNDSVSEAFDETFLINALRCNEINHIGDLIQLTEKELKRCPRIGKKTFNTIRDFLQKNNLCLLNEKE